MKENELKDSSLVDTYNSYLKTFQQYLEQPASVECMLPADLPTCDFVVDMLLHLCCMPVSYLSPFAIASVISLVC